MSSILGQYIETNNLNKKEPADGYSQTTNMPVKITSYTDEHFIGIRLDTKEEVKVKLRPYENKGKNIRPELEDFKSKKAKRFADPKHDSVLLFDNTYFDEKNDEWNSRWANTLTNQKFKSKVLVMNANIKIVEKPEFSYIEANIIKSKKIIQTVEELQAELTEAFTSRNYKSRTFAVIKLVDSTGMAYSITAYPNIVETEDEDGDKIKLMDTPENSYNNFVSDEKRSKIVFDFINNPEITVEMFVAAKLFLGGDTGTRILDNATEKARLKEEYTIQEDDGIKAGFRKTVLAVRDRADGSMFVSFVKPLTNNEDPVKLENLNM
jgi:hypothetical protein